MPNKLIEHLFSLPQYLLPHHPVSRAMHRLARWENPTWKNALIDCAVRFFGIDLEEALESNPDAYPNFNAFFTRAIKPEVRPSCEDDDALLCPADGSISQIGDIDGERILQAKGRHYSAVELLGGDAGRAGPFENGRFATVYLSPRDYHRLHMPLRGVLREMVHVPGRLFSVNPSSVDTIPDLFARNERVVSIFDTEAGPMAVVLVGAVLVASIETVWHGEVTPPAGTRVRVWNYGDDAPVLEKGEEMGRFNMGSTVIVLFGANTVAWLETLKAGDRVKVGQKLGGVCSTMLLN